MCEENRNKLCSGGFDPDDCSRAILHSRCPGCYSGTNNSQTLKAAFSPSLENEIEKLNEAGRKIISKNKEMLLRSFMGIPVRVDPDLVGLNYYISVSPMLKASLELESAKTKQHGGLSVLGGKKINHVNPVNPVEEKGIGS